MIKSSNFGSLKLGGVNRTKAILLMVVMLLVGVQQIDAEVTTLRRNFTATEGVQWYDVTNIDFNTQKVIVEVSNVSTTMTTAGKNELISFCGSEYLMGWREWCLTAYSGDGANLQVYAFTDKDANDNLHYTSSNATYSNHSVTFELSKANGLKVNGTVKATASQVANVTNKTSIKIGCTDAAHVATYTVKIVPLDYSTSSSYTVNNTSIPSSSIVSSIRENVTNNGSTTGWATNTNVNWDTQKVILSFDNNFGSASNEIFGFNVQGANTNTGAGGDIGWSRRHSVFFHRSGSNIQLYTNPANSNNPVSVGNAIAAQNGKYLVEISKQNGLVVNGNTLLQPNNSYMTFIFASSSLAIGCSNQLVTCHFDYVLVVDKDVELDDSYTSSTSFNESKYNRFATTTNYVNVQLQRSALSTTDWNTFCVPFNISMNDFKAVYGEDTKVWKFSAVDGNVMNFEEETTHIEAGKPYLVKPSTEGVENPTFYDVNITCSEPIEVGEGNYHMVGTFGLKQLDTENNFYLAAGGKFKKPSTDSAPMKGMRAYFIVNDPDANLAGLRLGFDGGGTTGISEIVGTDVIANDDTRVFNLQGQCVGTSLNGLRAGIYVQNGKKFIVK